jgi:dihydrolipoamide dehydrogenase
VGKGFKKILFDPDTHRVHGGIVGTNAGELTSVILLVIVTGRDAEDIGLTIHARPTLTELYIPRDK